MAQWVWLVSGLHLDKDVDAKVPGLIISNIFGLRHEQEQQSNPHRENAPVDELCTQLIQEQLNGSNFSTPATACKADDYEADS